MRGRSPLLAAAALALVLFALLWPRSSGEVPAALPPPTSGAMLDGAALFAAKGCSGCHDAPGVTASARQAPSLVDLGRRAGTRVAGLDAEAYVRQSVLVPEAYRVPGHDVHMPALPVDERELDALVRYLLG